MNSEETKETKKEELKNEGFDFTNPDFVKNFQQLTEKAYSLGYRLTHFPNGDLFVKGTLGFNMTGVYRWQSVNSEGTAYRWTKVVKMAEVKNIAEMEKHVLGDKN